MNVEPASIVGIPFPYTDLSTHKRRPVLILTNSDKRGDFTGLAITSVSTVEKAVCINDKSLKNGKLPKTSWVRYDKIFTLNGSLIKKTYGTLHDNAFNEIINCLCLHLGCDS